MARSRNIKPGFFTNGELLECSPLARLLFAELWCEADRRGVLKDQPKTLKVKVLPGDNCDIDALLDELAERDFIRRYEVDGVRCIWIVNFAVHQNPHVKEQASTLPDPPDIAGSSRQSADEHEASTGQAPDIHHASPADSLNPHPDSGFLIPESPPTPPTGGVTVADPDGDPLSTLDKRFTAFWDAYPRKVGKDAARKVWERRRPDRTLTEEMLAAIAAQRSSDAWTRESGRFVPNPATWLNQGRWQDEVPPPRLHPTVPPPPRPPALTTPTDQKDFADRFIAQLREA